MLWHASAVHLWSLPCRACRAGTKHNRGRGTHIKVSSVCCGFWRQNALHQKHNVLHANKHTQTHFSMHTSDTQLWIHVCCYTSLSRSFKKYFLNLSVLTVGNPARNPARPRTRCTLFDYFKHNWSCLLEDFLPQNPLTPFFILHMAVNNKQAISLFLSFPSHLILILLCFSWNDVLFMLVCVKNKKNKTENIVHVKIYHWTERSNCHGALNQ